MIGEPATLGTLFAMMESKFADGMNMVRNKPSLIHYDCFNFIRLWYLKTVVSVFF
jgi:hypothetical protein